MKKTPDTTSEMLQITTRVSAELALKLKIVCAHERRSKAKILEFALEAFVESYFAKNPELPLE